MPRRSHEDSSRPPPASFSRSASYYTTVSGKSSTRMSSCSEMTSPHAVLTRVTGSLAVALCIAHLACRSEILLNGPTSNSPPSDSTGADSTGADTTGTFQRASFTLRVILTGKDSAIAHQIGLTDGRLAQAAVTIERQASFGSRMTDTTDASGEVVFEELIPGTYNASAIRLVAPDEAALFDSSAADVNAFGGSILTVVESPATTRELPAFATRRGSLVISEISAPIMVIDAAGPYNFGGFIELYNNSDTTIYLDGIVIGKGISWMREFEPPKSCSEFDRWRNDPAGIWSAFFAAFPGHGRQHPLAPGATVVVATDAIDHREFIPDLSDLSTARFEFIGSADVDNPAAINMLDIGLREWGAGILGHGLDFSGLHILAFVAAPLDVGALLHDNLPVVNPDHVRIPHGAILDVISSILTPALEAAVNVQSCAQLVHRSLDGGFTNLYDLAASMALARGVVTFVDGRAVLLRTRSSRVDFAANVPPTPGRVP